MSKTNLARLRLILRILVGSVWVFHGFYSKILDLIPRHKLIVARILGEDAAFLTPFIGGAEVLMGLWVFSSIKPRLCALAQTCILVSMNLLEIIFAYDLLFHAPGMVALNAIFLGAAWFSAGARRD